MATGSLMTSLLVYGLAMAGAYFALIVFCHRRSALDERLAELQAEYGGPSRKPGRIPVAVRGAVPRQPVRKKPRMENFQSFQQYQLRLVHAGIYHPHALQLFLSAKIALMFIPIAVGLGVAIYGLCTVAQGMVIGCLMGCAGLIVPELWLKDRVRIRHALLRGSLPDFLDLLIICIEGGLSIQAAIQRVSDELRVAHPVLAGEFSIVQHDTELGASVEMALRRFAERTGYDGIRTLATFVRETQRFGTALGQALRDHGEMLRNQREMSAEESAQKASVKVLFPMLIFILPAVFVVLVGPAVIDILQAFNK